MEKTVILEMMLKVVMVKKSNYKLKVNFILKMSAVSGNMSKIRLMWELITV